MQTVSAAASDPRLRLWFSQTWGTMRTEARSYSRKDGTVVAGVDEQATYPLFGFQLENGAESYPIAEWRGNAVRFFPPPGATLQRPRAGAKGQFEPLPEGTVLSEGGRRYVDLPSGSSLRVTEGDSLLDVTVDVLKERAGWDIKKALFYMVFLVAAALGPPIAFFFIGPDPEMVGRVLMDDRVKRGLPAEPEPLQVNEGEPQDRTEDGRARPSGTLLVPASVR